MKALRIVPFCLVVIALTLTTPPRTVEAAEFRGLGFPSGNVTSHPNDISADGTVVVGEIGTVNFRQAARWTEEQGFEGLGTLPQGGYAWRGLGVSDNGATVVGTANDIPGDGDPYGSYYVGFRWTLEGGLVELVAPAGVGYPSQARDVSSDGSIVAGSGQGPIWLTEAVLWTADGQVKGLGVLPSSQYLLWPWAAYSEGTGVSADGSVVVGYSTSVLDTGESSLQPFRWSEATGMQPLGELPGGYAFGQALAISKDGSTVVGSSSSFDSQNGSGGQFTTEAFLWRQNEGMRGLGDLSGGLFESAALGVNGDGTVVVGWGITDGNTRVAFVWDETNGMRNLQEVLAQDHGLTAALAGWHLYGATAVSADGTIIIGWGSNPQGLSEGWRVNLSTSANVRPIAVTGTSITVHAGNTVSLDGRNSYDPDGNDPLAYEWRLIQVPAGDATTLLAEPLVATPLLTPRATGDYIAQLTVTDSLGATSDPALVTITATNQQPVAIIESISDAVVGDRVALISGSSDQDGDILSYSWYVTGPGGNAVAVSDPQASSTDIVANVAGAYTIRLEVTDGYSSATTTTGFNVITVHDAIVVATEALATVVGQLDPNFLKNRNQKIALGNKLDEVLTLVSQGDYQTALAKLQSDVLGKTNGCGDSADNNDWIVDCAIQSELQIRIAAILSLLNVVLQ